MNHSKNVLPMVAFLSSYFRQMIAFSNRLCRSCFRYDAGEGEALFLIALPPSEGCASGADASIFEKVMRRFCIPVTDLDSFLQSFKNA